MKRFLLIAMLAACHDQAVDTLTELKSEACACQSFACVVAVEVKLDQHKADFADPKNPVKAKKAAEAVVACLADARARIGEETQRAIEQKLHGVDSGP